MATKVLCFCFLTLHILRVQSEFPDYFWREYTGEISQDALPAGKDGNGNDTYVGQVYINDYGVFIGEIFPGRKQVDVQCFGVKKVESNIKILCTRHKDKFSWLPTTVSTFHTDTADKEVVHGGYNHMKNDSGVLDVGRVSYEGGLRVGAVASHHVERVPLYIVHNNQQKRIENYEVLIYKNS